MAGVSQGPVPWWQLPEHRGRFANLTNSAPAGMEFDPTSFGFRPIVGSPSDLLAQRARSQRFEDEDRSQRMSARERLTGLLDRSNTSGSFGISDFTTQQPLDFTFTPPARSGMGAPSVRSVAPISAPDTSGAQAAMFARAKDKVGEETSGSLTALRSALAARGLLGGGGERRATANILTRGQAELGDTTREQTIQEANRASDFAKLGFEGSLRQREQDIAQRGQDVAQNEAEAGRAFTGALTNFQGQIAQRNANLQARLEATRLSQAEVAARNSARAEQQRNLVTLLSQLQ